MIAAQSRALSWGKARGGDSRQRSAADDNLRMIIALRFNRNRVHRDRWRDTRRFGLDDLSASDFLAGRGDERIERHVLRLERRDTQSLLLENPAQRGDKNAFPTDEPVPWTISVLASIVSQPNLISFKTTNGAARNSAVVVRCR